jgi:nitroreductase
MMELFETIAARYSYRGAFDQTPVPREHLEKIVLAGCQAPSGVNAQTTRFIIIDNPELLRAIGELAPGRPVLHSCTAMIVCLIDTHPEEVYRRHSFQVEDCAAAVENMLLAITALGYASVWIDGWVRVDNRAEKIGKMLGIPADKCVRVILPLGVPTEEYPRKSKLPFDRRAWFNRYAGDDQDTSAES